MTLAHSRHAVDPGLAERLRKVRLVVFDFDGVFTDNMVYVFQDGTEAVRCTRFDGLGLQALRRAGLDLLVLSTETNPIVSVRCRKLGIPCTQACEDKRAALESLLSSKGLVAAQVAYVGNDVNDLACLRLVGVPIVVQDAHPDVWPFAVYRTQALGGHGAVREVCDLLVSVLEPGERHG